MEELKVVARQIRHQAALDLLRDGEVDSIEALALVLIPPEDVLAASIEAAKLKLAARSGVDGAPVQPIKTPRSQAAPRREIVWAHR